MFAKPMLPLATDPLQGDSSMSNKEYRKFIDPTLTYDYHPASALNLLISGRKVMPVYMCRWPHGGFSFVFARNRPEAEIALDEVDNAEGCPFLVDRNFMVHFYLADDGSFQLGAFGEDTHLTVWKRYPVLDEAFDELYETDPKFRSRAETPEQHKVIAKAVEKERNRVDAKAVRPPRGLREQGLRGQTGAPWSLIEYWINLADKERLQNLNPEGEPN